MKPHGFLKYKYSGEYYKFVVIENGTDIEIEYYASGTVSFRLDIDDNQRLTLKTEEPLPIGSLIANIRDSSNNLVLDDMVWQTQTLSPILDVFNNIVFYRSRASMFQGELNVQSV